MFHKKTVKITTSSSNVSKQIGLGVGYVRLYGFKGTILTAAGAAGDSSTEIKIVDADSRVLYLDAANKDYSAGLDKVIVQDDTTTGLSVTPVDTTGAAAASGESGFAIIARSPLTISVLNGGTTTDVMTVDLYYES